MPAKNRVSLTVQVVLCLVPLLDIYAAYRIKKLRCYLLIMLPLGAMLGVIDMTAFPSVQDEAWDEFPTNMLWFYYDYDDPGYVQFLIVTDIVVYAVAIFLVLRWSFVWNKQFEGSVSRHA